MNSHVNEPTVEEKEEEELVCYICWEPEHSSTENPIRRDCGCRGTGGWAHIDCIVAACKAQREACISLHVDWIKCIQCQQAYNGPTKKRLREELPGVTAVDCIGLFCTLFLLTLIWKLGFCIKPLLGLFGRGSQHSIIQVPSIIGKQIVGPILSYVPTATPVILSETLMTQLENWTLDIRNFLSHKVLGVGRVFTTVANGLLGVCLELFWGVCTNILKCCWGIFICTLQAVPGYWGVMVVFVAGMSLVALYSKAFMRSLQVLTVVPTVSTCWILITRNGVGICSWLAILFVLLIVVVHVDKSIAEHLDEDSFVELVIAPMVTSWCILGLVAFCASIPIGLYVDEYLHDYAPMARSAVRNIDWNDLLIDMYNEFAAAIAK